jgi:hypothetical protein
LVTREQVSEASRRNPYTGSGRRCLWQSGVAIFENYRHGPSRKGCYPSGCSRCARLQRLGSPRLRLTISKIEVSSNQKQLSLIAVRSSTLFWRFTCCKVGTATLPGSSVGESPGIGGGMRQLLYIPTRTFLLVPLGNSPSSSKGEKTSLGPSREPQGRTRPAPECDRERRSASKSV